MSKTIKRYNKKQKKLIVMNNKANSSNITLNSSHKELDHFCSIATNEIKTAVNNIGLDLHKLDKEYNLNNQSKEIIRNFKEDTSKLFQLTNSLIKSTLNTKNTTLKPQEINFIELLKDVKNSLKNSIALIEPSFILPQEFPRFYAYRVQLYQLFKNMIENSLKYSHPGRECIIKINIEKKQNWCIITISDNGLGIPDNKLDKVFQLFSQSRESDLGKGSGLGLSICKKIAANYGGYIELNSVVNEGTSFTIFLQETKKV